MSQSTPGHSSNGDTIPSWMTTVDEETLYNAENSAETNSSDSPTDAPDEAPAAYASRPHEVSGATSPEPASGRPDASEAVALGEELALSMADPDNIPSPNPDLQPTIVGRVRSDLDEQLEKAVSVLGTRYAVEVSRSLVLEFALHRALRVLREDGAESPLVEWLDSVLPRR